MVRVPVGDTRSECIELPLKAIGWTTGEMREQDDAIGYPSVALQYGVDIGGDKVLQVRSLDPARRLLGGLDDATLRDLHRECRRNGTDLATEIAASGLLDETEIARAIARTLGLLEEPPTPEHTIVDGNFRSSSRLVRSIGPDLRPLVHIAPRIEDLDLTAAFLWRNPGLREAIRVATPTQIRRMREQASVASRSDSARQSLSKDASAFSARHTLSGSQGVALGASIALAFVAAALLPSAALLLHAALLPLYFACTGLRVAAAFDRLRMSRPMRAAVPAVASDGSAPVPGYSILVALRNEPAECVDTLVASLSDLRWPASRRQVFLICEEDDPATAASCERATAGLHGFHVVRVPSTFPRTKPKALNFTLPLATGEFIALFDAEDRPHPDQLLAAWQAFREGGPGLACVQAPLVISNASRHWLARHFAMEYAVLFKGFLPWLAARGMPLPLGGTSNHFRAEALREVGAWDSHNVAEDADLGIRLFRYGYRTGTITPPTLEDAPERWSDWRNQRTRWMKGWCQSWLVHMRDPARLRRELGWRNFIVVQLLFAGMIASALAHTVLFVLVFQTLAALVEGWPEGAAGWLLALDCAALAIGYAAYAALAVQCHGDRRGVLKHIWSVPAYWTLVGFATLRAVHQLRRNPQLWEKTPHGLSARAPVLARPA